MKTKKKLTRGIALCLTTMLLFAMGMTAFAQIDADSKGSITVTGLSSDEGTTLAAYQLAEVNFDYTGQQPTEPVYTWVGTVAAWLTENGYSAYVGTDNELTDAYLNANAASLRTLYQALEAAIGEGALTLTNVANGAAITSGSAVITGVAMGQYLILATPASGNTTVYQPVVANVYPAYDEEWTITNATVALKGSAPEIVKTVTDADSHVKVGDTVNYQLAADIPSYPEDAVSYRFVIGDQMGAGLAYDANSIQFKIGTDEATAESLTATYYTASPETGFAFRYEMNYKQIKADYPNATKIYVTYAATVTEDAITGTDALTNTPILGYSSDPYAENSYVPGGGDSVKVYTYGFTLTKKDQADKEVLTGAEFEVQTAEGTALEFVKDGDVYRPLTAAETANSATERVAKLSVGTNGQLSIQGVDLGTYYLVETKAPAGYVLPKDPVVIQLGEVGDVNGSLDAQNETQGTFLTATTGYAGELAITTNQAAFDVYNVDHDASFHLPKTGGMGTVLFTILGILLMGGAVAYVVVSKKRSCK